ncbi:MAG: tetraacyldisaccharide 4'-kinase [bacterium]
MTSIQDVWYGASAGDRVARAVLWPASWLYGTVVGMRNRRYAQQGSAVHPSALPVLSLGNITVGGTGKTPVAAWAAARLRARGGRPAIVMRGYGEDEPLVHAKLNPDVPVIVGGDRVRGAERAKDALADCAILDDGFQHRRIARVADWVLVAAERWRDDLALLPAGPLREPMSALGRADAIIVTRKSASGTEANAIAARLGARFPHVGVAVCHLAMDMLVDAMTGEHRELAWLSGKHIVAAAAVGEPQAFFAQLRALGARVEERPFRDHHAFDATDARDLVESAGGCDGVVCTLKDAVKLAPLWTPAAAPLWYVSQIAVIERGESVLDHGLEAVLAARQAVTSTAG